MADEQNVDRTLIQVESDLASVQRTIRDLDKIRDAQRRISDEAKRSSLVGQQSAKGLVQAYNDVKKAVEGAAAAESKLRTERERGLKQAASSVGGIGGATSGIRSLASAAGLGGLSSGVDAASDVLELAEALPKLKEGLSSLPAAAKAAVDAIGVGNVGMIGGIAAATIAIKLLNDQFERTKTAARAQLDATTQYFSIVATGTTESLAKEKEAADERVKAAQAAYDTAQSFNYQLQRDTAAAYGDVGLAIAQLNASLGTNNGELKASQEAVDAAAKELGLATAQQGLYARALQDGQVAANDAALAEQKLTEARQKLADNLVNTEIATLQKAQTMTGEQAKARLKAIEDETAAIERFIGASGQSPENVAALQQRIDNLATEYTLLKQLTPTLIAHNDALAAASKSIIDAVKSLPDKLKEAAAWAKKFSEAAGAVKEAHQENAENLEKISDDLTFKLSEAARDRNLALVEAERDATIARAEAIRDRDNALNEAARNANKDREEAERSHNERLAEIQRQYNRSAQQAISDRDAVALDQAEQQRKDAQSDESRAYDKRLKDIDRALSEENRQINIRYNDQLRDIDTRLQEQNRAIQMRYDEQVRSAQIAAQQSIAAENERFQKELAVKMKAYNDILGIEQQGSTATTQVHSAFWQGALNLAKNALAGLRSAATTQPAAVAPLPGTGGVGNAPYPTPPSLDTGGKLTRDGLYYGHKDELVINPKRGQGAGLTVPITVNGFGMSPSQIADTVREELYATLVGAKAGA